MMKFFIFTLLAAYVVCQSPEEGDMVEGDIELDPDQMAAYMEQMEKAGNSFAAIKSNLWKTNGRADNIKYYIDSQISGASSAISQAIADYQKYTCIRFSRQSRRPSGPHLFFTTGSGCSSPVGRMSRGNSIRLARGCWRKGTIIHEIGHSIGLFHEQSRPDRDNFVTIRWENIKEQNKHNFNKMRASNWNKHDTNYDYDSIMHYGSRYFTKNGGLTIQTKNSADQTRIGKRSGFSETDKIQINRMYCQGSTCADKDSRCSGWTSYCRTNNFVKTNCKKTCSLC
ncbi:hatching enzyme 1.2-like [Clytia hemisphaerica]|uniref:Metalloendopeptidase n=2 Tax=Clytia hemisphaerica TaxID=252671 RepID=A0A7M6DMQ7_9CNID|eukprot:TCONS_00057830-protein